MNVVRILILEFSVEIPVYDTELWKYSSSHFTAELDKTKG